jgi:hypothetical protein
MKRLLAQLEDTAQNFLQAEAIRDGSMIAMSNASWRHPLLVNKFFMRRAKSFMATVIKTALGIEHYWGRVEFAPGRGAIHCHIVAIANDMAYLQDFFHAKTTEDKAAVVNKYAREHLDMTADVEINDDKQRRLEYQNSPLGKRYCKSPDQTEVDSLQKIACVTNVINTACNWQKQTRMAQEHASSFWNRNKTRKTRHTRSSTYNKVQNIYRQERHFTFHNEKNKIS